MNKIIHISWVLIAICFEIFVLMTYFWGLSIIWVPCVCLGVIFNLLLYSASVKLLRLDFRKFVKQSILIAAACLVGVWCNWLIARISLNHPERTFEGLPAVVYLSLLAVVGILPGRIAVALLFIQSFRDHFRAYDRGRFVRSR